MSHSLLLALVMVCFSLTGCFERIVEPADVFGDIHQGKTYSPASQMIDDWYAVEAIDAQTFAINEPKSSQYNTSYLIVGEAEPSCSMQAAVNGLPDLARCAKWRNNTRPANP